jgi:hypothetical protein
LTYDGKIAATQREPHFRLVDDAGRATIMVIMPKNAVRARST